MKPMIRESLLVKSSEVSQVYLLTDENVAPLWLSETKKRLGVEKAVEMIIKSGEQYKNLTTVQQIWETLI